MSNASGTAFSVTVRNFLNSTDQWRGYHLPMTSPVAISRAARSDVVPLRL